MSEFIADATQIWSNFVHELSQMSLGMMLWLGLAILTFALLILIGTRWGQVKPVWKCVVLSLLAHVLLGGYAYGTRLMFTVPTLTADQSIELKLVELDQRAEQARVRYKIVTQPWDQFEITPDQTPELVDASRIEPEIQPTVVRSPGQSHPMVQPTVFDGFESVTEKIEPGNQQPEFETTSDAYQVANQRLPVQSIDIKRKKRSEQEPFVSPQTEELARMEVADSQAPSLSSTTELTNRDDKKDIEQLLQQLARVTERPTSVRMTAPAVSKRAFQHNPSDDLQWSHSPTDVDTLQPISSRHRLGDGQPMPVLFHRRSVTEREKSATLFGGGPHTERAVTDALRWLSQNQELDGRWRASRFGAGQERLVLGHDRNGAGSNADTGITALSLLAFLAADHTHLEGPYRESVQKGLEFLLNSQAQDGNLAGGSRLFAKMYCHAMATLAISEALAVTGDQRLINAVDRAVQFSVRAQNPVDGGWRYQPGDRGDMSQFGWQVMALKSAELGGIAIPERTKSMMKQFLSRCTSGNYGGLAGYRPGHPATAPMTAEALLCQYFICDEVNVQLANEAIQLILSERPGQGENNFYYWYYATLALFQRGGASWTTWNSDLTAALIQSQNREGDLAGSWDPNGVWCGYGGRVYSTAMATLCLEVYYRYSTSR